MVNRFFGIFFMFFQSSSIDLVFFAKSSFVLNLGQVWGNLISYLVLKPIEIEQNNSSTTLTSKYEKCGASFSELEYKGVEVINQIDRKTVNSIDVTMENYWGKKTRFSFEIGRYSLHHLHLHLCLFDSNRCSFSQSTTKSSSR